MRIGPDADVETLAAAVRDLEQRRQLAEGAGLELDKASRAVERAKAQEADAIVRMAGADSAAVAAQGTLAAAEAVLAERQAAVPEELRRAGALERELDAVQRRHHVVQQDRGARVRAAEHPRQRRLSRPDRHRAAALVHRRGRLRQEGLRRVEPYHGWLHRRAPVRFRAPAAIDDVRIERIASARRIR